MGANILVDFQICISVPLTLCYHGYKQLSEGSVTKGNAAFNLLLKQMFKVIHRCLSQQILWQNVSWFSSKHRKRLNRRGFFLKKSERT